MELLPGVAPAASEPKFTESSSIFLNSADESNSNCRKLVVCPKYTLALRRRSSRSQNRSGKMHARQKCQEKVMRPFLSQYERRC
jgi:hypothetical protein